MMRNVALTAAALSLNLLFCPRAGAGHAPLSLTAADGTGLELRALRARTVLEGPLAYTQLHLTFKNPKPTTIEGRFSITMPEGAAISRFAMRIGGDWQEAEVVERQKARVVYESFMHRRVDPALLEREAGNRFRARVFPVPARGEKHLLVSYSQELASRHEPYRLPLRGLPRIGRIAVSVKTASGATLRQLSRERYLPIHDLEVARPRGVDGLTHGGLSVARVRPRLPEERVAAPLDSLLVLFDTSASRAPELEAQLDALDALIDALTRRHGRDLALRVVCFDQTVETIFEGRAADFGHAQLKQIRSRGALGASDIGRALDRASRGQKRYRRVVLFTDGVPTAGAIHPRRLRRAVARLRARGVERLDLLLTGAARDLPAARRLVTRNGLARDGAVLDGELPAHLLGRRLSLQVFSAIRVKVPGASWTWPARLDGIQPGDEVLVYAKSPRTSTLEVRLAGARLPRQSHRVRLRAASAGGALLNRAWARARIEWLSTVPQLTREVEREIVDLSTRHRVLSDLTAMIVLETEYDYQRFGITRRSLSNIVVVDRRGLQVVQRQPHLRRIDRRRWQPPPPPDVRAARSRLETLARSWNSSNSSGRAAVRLRTRRAQAPRVVMSRVVVMGGLSKETLRRTIRRQYNKVRHCYEKELQADRGLAGRVVMQIVIEEGTVVLSRVVSSTLGNRAAETCIARTFFNMRFPEVKHGGTVEVFYPLVLRPRRRHRSPRRPAGPHAVDAAPVGFSRLPPSVVTRDRQLPPVPDPAELLPVERRETTVYLWRPTASKPPSQYTGRMATIQAHIARGRLGSALRGALRWRRKRPGDMLALVALGDALRAAGAPAIAARAYGSIIDLCPSRADRRRFAGGLLETVGRHRLAADSYARALRLRPDHPSGYRLLAMALVRRGQVRRAFTTLVSGLKRRYPEDRFFGVKQVLREDLALVASAWIARRPGDQAEVLERLAPFKLVPASRSSLRLVLTWESDASNLSLLVRDRYSEELEPRRWNDVTTGYGPERLRLGGKTNPLSLKVFAYDLGSTGHGMGKVQIVRHDGRGGLRLEDRAFVVMRNGVEADLGLVRRQR
jgi:Flp pilus assembly protein TadD